MNHRILITLPFLLAATACSSGSVSDSLGLGRHAPDEFRVVSRPPLSVPPEFNLLPPASANDAPATPPADQQAKTMMLGTPVETSATPAAVGVPASAPPKTSSSAESEFLRDAGADKANPAIRTTLAQDKALAEAPAPEQEEEHHWWNFFSGSEKKDPVVDASKESTRIQQNTVQGQPVTTGTTPNVPQKDTGVLGSIFGY